MSWEQGFNIISFRTIDPFFPSIGLWLTVFLRISNFISHGVNFFWGNEYKALKLIWGLVVSQYIQKLRYYNISPATFYDESFFSSKKERQAAKTKRVFYSYPFLIHLSTQEAACTILKRYKLIHCTCNNYTNVYWPILKQISKRKSLYKMDTTL